MKLIAVPKLLFLGTVIMIVALSLTYPKNARADVTADQQAITNVLMSGAPSGTTIVAVVVVQNYALAIQVQPGGETAKDVLLINTNATWSVVTAVGGQFAVSDLVNHGVPSDVAQSLIDQQVAAT